MSIAYNLSRFSAPCLRLSKPEKQEGLLISPGSGGGGQKTSRLGVVLFLLGIGLLLSGFILIMALISLILF
jgi:hypothetical protein